MKLSFRIYLSVTFFTFFLFSCMGFFYGKREIENQFKISVSVGWYQASEYFDEGDVKQALSRAYYSKAFERERGKPDPLLSETLTDGLLGRPGVDLLLGKIFLKKNQPCLAQGYLIDGFTYLNEEKALTELPMYKETAELLGDIGKDCTQWKGTS